MLPYERYGKNSLSPALAPVCTQTGGRHEAASVGVVHGALAPVLDERLREHLDVLCGERLGFEHLELRDLADDAERGLEIGILDDGEVLPRASSVPRCGGSAFESPGRIR